IWFTNSSLLPNVSNFIKTNGKNLSRLSIHNRFNNTQYLGELIQSIGETCQKLRWLSVSYNGGVEQQLLGIFNNCIELHSISFSNVYYDVTIDADKVLAVLNQTLPRNLKSIKFGHEFTISENSLEILMNNWKGPKPLEFRLYRKYLEKDDNGLNNLLKKYENLGFLKQIYVTKRCPSIKC